MRASVRPSYVCGNVFAASLTKMELSVGDKTRSSWETPGCTDERKRLFQNAGF